MYLFKIIKLRLLFLLIIIPAIPSSSLADLVKPNNAIEPILVVKIQLRGLMNNDEPTKDRGIEQTWEFAHPNNKKYTGPIQKFKNMIKGDSYSMLLDHTENRVTEVYTSEDVATFEVVVLDKYKKYYKFKWQVEKYKKNGPLKGCWLTTAVSQPIAMGSSI